MQQAIIPSEPIVSAPESTTLHRACSTLFHPVPSCHPRPRSRGTKSRIPLCFGPVPIGTLLAVFSADPPMNTFSVHAVAFNAAGKDMKAL